MKVKMINVLMVASVSAALHGVMAVLFVPFMSFMFLAQHTTHAQMNDPAMETGMVIAVVAPLCWTAVGFIGGAAMAFLWNLFAADPSRTHKLVLTERVRVARASQSSVA